MNRDRYELMFDKNREKGSGIFGAFVMLGDPDLEASARILSSLANAGADMLEVGIPFSDPLADGPVIQAASTRALEAGVRVDDCFSLIAKFRAKHDRIPIGILTYANIVMARGTERFCQEARDAGVDSLLIADVPSIEALPFVKSANDAGIAPIFIAATNTPRAVLQDIAHMGQGYTYCVARSGVTGADDEIRLDHSKLFQALQEVGAPPPILGFGIAKPSHVQSALSAGAAGVVSGSAIVDLIARNLEPCDAIESFVRTMKAATLRSEAMR